MMEPPVRVLLVGGHPVITGVARLGCEAIEGLEVAGEATTVAEALERASDLHPDVLVLDLDLPDGDGLDVLRAMRDAGFTGSVVVLSERVDGSTVLEATRLGAAGFLAKPDGLRRIGPTLSAVIAGERVVAPSLEDAAVSELGRLARQAREHTEVSDSLTVREREILVLLADGFTTHQIGSRLHISPRTVETHVGKLYRKLEVRTRVQAVARAASLGLVEIG